MADSTVQYEWHIADRVYIIRMDGVVTVSLMETALHHVLTMLNSRSCSVHLIYHIETVRLEPSIPLNYILDVTAVLYRHRNTASLISVIGLNRLHAFLANSARDAFSRENQQGQAVGTLNEALRLVHSIDSSLPPMNL